MEVTELQLWAEVWNDSSHRDDTDRNMSGFLRPTQLNRIFKRNIQQIVATVEQRSHDTGKGAVKLWRNISFFVGFPAIALAMLNCYLRHKEKEKHGHQRPEYKPYSYMKIMNKPFPWRDGKKSLFHNPKNNFVPGVGYEE